MSTLMLLGIALAAVAVLLVLVIKAELPAYVALLLVSMGTAVVTGIAIDEVVPVMIAGMGKVLGSVAIGRLGLCGRSGLGLGGRFDVGVLPRLRLGGLGRLRGLSRRGGLGHCLSFVLRRTPGASSR